MSKVRVYVYELYRTQYKVYIKYSSEAIVIVGSRNIYDTAFFHCYSILLLIVGYWPRFNSVSAETIELHLLAFGYKRSMGRSIFQVDRR